MNSDTFKKLIENQSLDIDLFADDDISIIDLMKSKMVFLSALFIAEAQDSSDDIEDLNYLFRQLENYIDAYINDGDSKQLKEYILKVSRGIKSDKLSRLFLAFASFSISDRYLSLKNNYDALRYYERGITYCSLDDLDKMKANYISYVRKKDGRKGGRKGAYNNVTLSQIYEYHDVYLSEKKENGRFKYSAPRAVEEIKKNFSNAHYGHTTLETYIKRHRRKNFKD